MVCSLVVIVGKNAIVIDKFENEGKVKLILLLVKKNMHIDFVMKVKIVNNYSFAILVLGKNTYLMYIN